MRLTSLDLSRNPAVND
jgi:hypothetical protein